MSVNAGTLVTDCYDSYCCFRNKKETGYRILWELTAKCNLGCPFCHVSPTRELAFPQIEAIMHQLKELPISDIIFTGGEPLLRKDMFDILDLAQQMEFKMDLCTNATLVTERIAYKLLSYLSEVSVSLDGDAAVHNRSRGSDKAYDRTIKGIRTLIGAGHQVHLTCVVTKYNFQRLTEVFEIAQDLGADSLAFLGLIESQMANPDAGSGLKLTAEELQQVRETISGLRNHSTMKLNTKRIFPQLAEESCTAGTRILGITAEGELRKCILLKDAYVHDFKQGALTAGQLNTLTPHHCTCF
jgi:MoaA/NifB/PqqE/SkfB family radical SAM enzyme